MERIQEENIIVRMQLENVFLVKWEKPTLVSNEAEHVEQSKNWECHSRFLSKYITILLT